MLNTIEEKQVAVIRREDRYLAFPALVCLDNGDLLMAFRSGRNCYRDFPEALNFGYQHPHTDPFSEPWLARSSDGGRSWRIVDPPRPRALLDADHAAGIAYQDVGLTKLPDGRVMLSAFRWKYSDEPPANGLNTPVREESLVPTEPGGYDFRRYQPYRYAYRLAPMYSIADATGRHWMPFKPVDVPEPVTGNEWGLATRNGGVMLDERTVGWPFYVESDEVARARSGCHLLKYDVPSDTWSYGAQLAAGSEELMMEEPLVHRRPDGVLLGLYRTTTPGYMFVNESHDNGETWSEAVQTDVWGHPFSALNLPSGDVLLAYGYRREPMGIRIAVLDRGDVSSFNATEEIIIRDDALNDDSGYPSLCYAQDGAIVLAYYYLANDEGGEAARYIAVERLDPQTLLDRPRSE